MMRRKWSPLLNPLLVLLGVALLLAAAGSYRGQHKDEPIEEAAVGCRSDSGRGLDICVGVEDDERYEFCERPDGGVVTNSSCFLRRIPRVCLSHVRDKTANTTLIIERDMRCLRMMAFAVHHAADGGFDDDQDGNDVHTHPPTLSFHTFWFGTHLGRRQLMMFASLLVAHRDAARDRRLNVTLWTVGDAGALVDRTLKLGERDPELGRLARLLLTGDVPHVHVRAFRANELMPPEHAKLAVVADKLVDEAWLARRPVPLVPGEDVAGPPVSYSDFVRVVVLHKLGGIYLDIDALILRDFGELEFLTPYMYRWSMTPDMNTAVLSLAANSSISTLLLDCGLRSKLNPAYKALNQNGPFAAFHPWSLSRCLLECWRKAPSETTCANVLSAVLMDPLWANKDGVQLDLARGRNASCPRFRLPLTFPDAYLQDVRYGDYGARKAADPNTPVRIECWLPFAFAVHTHGGTLGRDNVHPHSFAAALETAFLRHFEPAG